jgi:DNA polymerase, archaea type
VKDFERTESLKDPLALYVQETKEGKRSKSAAYEVALMYQRTSERFTRVSYYITGNDPNPRVFENCKPASEWDPNFPDENVPFYLKRLDEYSTKFRPFFLPQDYRNIFSVEDLFSFDSQGVTPVTTSIRSGDDVLGESLTPKEGDEEE